MHTPDQSPSLHSLTLDELLGLARRVDLIDGYVRTGDQLTLRLGATALDFSEEQAALYLRGLLRGHVQTLHDLQGPREAGARAAAHERERTILMVDDDDEDCFIVRSAMLRLKPAIRFECVNSGDEMMTYLAEARGAGGRSFPDLILLDINMPVRNGIEVLRDLRASDQYAHLPVIMLTTSTSEADVHRSYGAGSNAFVTKPASRAEMDRLLQAITQFWFTSARLPEA